MLFRKQVASSRSCLLGKGFLKNSPANGTFSTLNLLSDNLTKVCEAARKSTVILLWMFTAQRNKLFHVKWCTFKPRFPLVPVSLTLSNCLASFNKPLQVELVSWRISFHWRPGKTEIRSSCWHGNKSFHHSKEDYHADQMIFWWHFWDRNIWYCFQSSSLLYFYATKLSTPGS